MIMVIVDLHLAETPWPDIRFVVEIVDIMTTRTSLPTPELQN